MEGDQINGYYPGDEFRGVKHEVRIDPGDYIFIPLADPLSASNMMVHFHRTSRIRESPDDHGFMVWCLGILRVL